MPKWCILGKWGALLWILLALSCQLPSGVSLAADSLSWPEDMSLSGQPVPSILPVGGDKAGTSLPLLASLKVVL